MALRGDQAALSLARQGAGQLPAGSRQWLWPVLVVVCLLGSGCAGSPRPATSVPTSSGSPAAIATAISRAPATASDCETASDPGTPNGSVVARLDWPTGERALDTPAQAYLCIDSFTGSMVTVAQSGSELTVQPARSWCRTAARRSR